MSNGFLLWAVNCWLIGATSTKTRHLAQFVIPPDQGASWYEWHLAEPTFWSRATAWGFYLAHQFTLWYLIYYAQKHKLSYTSGLHRLNIIALAVNALFIVLHFMQTHIWYDGVSPRCIYLEFTMIGDCAVGVGIADGKRSSGMFFGKKLLFPKKLVVLPATIMATILPGLLSIPFGTTPWLPPQAI